MVITSGNVYLNDPICPLCERPIPANVPQSRHHLIPKLKGGRGSPTILVHHQCHKEIHSYISEADLAKKYNSIELLKAHPDLNRFLTWIAKRPPSFMSKSRHANRKKC